MSKSGCRTDTPIRQVSKAVQALHWLNVAYEEQSPYLVNLQIEPRLDPLRWDPRFQDLVQRVGLKNVRALPISASAAAAAN